ncbi:hypothetical protein BH11BAC7_BH11BAC7_09620 [soil metagenome]
MVKGCNFYYLVCYRNMRTLLFVFLIIPQFVFSQNKRHKKVKTPHYYLEGTWKVEGALDTIDGVARITKGDTAISTYYRFGTLFGVEIYSFSRRDFGFYSAPNVYCQLSDTAGCEDLVDPSFFTYSVWDNDLHDGYEMRLKIHKINSTEIIFSYYDETDSVYYHNKLKKVSNVKGPIKENHNLLHGSWKADKCNWPDTNAVISGKWMLDIQMTFLDTTIQQTWMCNNPYTEEIDFLPYFVEWNFEMQDFEGNKLLFNYDRRIIIWYVLQNKNSMWVSIYSDIGSAGVSGTYHLIRQ